MQKAETHKHLLFPLIALLIGIPLILLFFDRIITIFTQLQSVKEFLLSFGMLSPIIFIILVTSQVLFAPIPGQAVGLAGGYIFGALFGTIFSMIGLAIGSYIAFTLARRYGRPCVEHFVSKTTLAKLDRVTRTHGKYALFLFFLLPGLPDDILCFIVGLSKIRTSTFMLLSITGRLPGFLVLNLVGSGISMQKTNISVLILYLLLIISMFFYIYHEHIRRTMQHLAYKLSRRNS